MFQSSAIREAGCNLDFGQYQQQYIMVSILSQPEGRLQCVMFLVHRRELVFQSSPGQKAGCKNDWQSAPGRGIWVSILTRPEGRVQDAAGPAPPWPPECFNPHPARRPGASGRDGQFTSIHEMFQSSPGQKAGCKWAIKIRWYTEPSWFQSSPGQKAGCKAGLSTVAAPGTTVFQSSPGQKAGCKLAECNRRQSGNRFNPHPARRPGARSRSASAAPPVIRFQSSPGQKAGCKLPAASALAPPKV